MSEPIAEREYTLLTNENEKLTVRVTLAQPVIDPESPHGDWKCDLTIYWPDGKNYGFKGRSVDSLGAVAVALELLEVELEKIKRACGDKFHFLEGCDLL